MKPSQRRWLILALLVVASAVNNIQRQTVSVLAPTLREELHLSEHDYSNAVTAFLIPYMLMYVSSGRLVDVFGVRLVLAISYAWWSIAGMVTGLARSALSLEFCRFLLGIGEPCVFTAGVKACAEWFPPQQRAIANGGLSSGASIGSVLAPPLVAICALWFGWRYAFVLIGVVALIWLPVWLRTYRDCKPSDATEKLRPTGLELLRRRQVWAVVLPRVTSDPIWYFCLFWIPDYLQRARHLNLFQIAAFGWIPFVFADIGNIAGGAASDWLVRRGVEPARARLWLLTAVGCISPVAALTGILTSLDAAIALVCLLLFLSQAWSANIATLASEILPMSEVATTVGMMGTAGGLGGILFAQAIGFLIPHYGYSIIFEIAACLLPVSVITLRSLLRLKK